MFAFTDCHCLLSLLLLRWKFIWKKSNIRNATSLARQPITPASTYCCIIDSYDILLSMFDFIPKAIRSTPFCHSIIIKITSKFYNIFSQLKVKKEKTKGLFWAGANKGDKKREKQKPKNQRHFMNKDAPLNERQGRTYF